MLNGQTVNIKKGGDFEAIPADQYTVILSDVNLIEQTKFQSIEVEQVLNYEMIILDNKFLPEKPGDKVDHPIMGRKLWKRCRQSLNEKSWLGKLVKAVYGRDLTGAEEAEFMANPEIIVGKQVCVLVELVEKGDKTYNNIISFAKCAKELKVEDFVQSKIGGKNDTPVFEKSSVSVNAPEEEVEDPELTKLKKEVDEAEKSAK